ncbi:MAG: DNA gyrase inhibitor YacG [Parvibaculales bacterium]
MADKKPLCPICKTEETQKATRPFCSKRCADIDLHRWLGEKYTIPAVEPPDNWDESELDGGSGETTASSDPTLH